MPSFCCVLELKRFWTFLLEIFDCDIPMMVLGIIGMLEVIAFVTLPLWGDRAIRSWMKFRKKL